MKELATEIVNLIFDNGQITRELARVKVEDILLNWHLRMAEVALHLKHYSLGDLNRTYGQDNEPIIESLDRGRGSYSCYRG